MGEPASLSRRFAAIMYDCLLLFALGVLATLPFLIAAGGEQSDLRSGPLHTFHQVSVLGVAYAFFVGFWWRKGRTLGMQSWGLQLQTKEAQVPSLRATSIRFFAALLSWLPAGLGFLWQLWDKDKLTWHDRLSGTRLMYYPRPGKSG